MRSKPDPRCYAAARDLISSGAWEVDPERGVIITHRRAGRVIGGKSGEHGYQQVVVRTDGKLRRIAAHRVIWEHVHGPIADRDLVINHINGDRLDNRIQNLELVSQKENVLHASRRGALPKGERVWAAKLTEADVREIRRASAMGETAVALGKRFGINQSTATRIIQGKMWAHVQ